MLHNFKLFSHDYVYVNVLFFLEIITQLITYSKRVFKLNLNSSKIYSNIFHARSSLKNFKFTQTSFI